jgi:hypothetical protein
VRTIGLDVSEGQRLHAAAGQTKDEEETMLLYEKYKTEE